MIRITTLQDTHHVHGCRSVALICTLLVAAASIAGCSSSAKSSSAQGGGEVLRTHDSPAPIPGPAAAVHTWAYSEAPAVPSGMKPRQVLNNLTFASGSASIDAEGQGALMAAAKELKANTSWHVLAVGFAGNQGEEAGVSQARAESVKKFLESQGIDAGRISTMGLGTKYAKSREYEPGQEAMDRRVEVWSVTN